SLPSQRSSIEARNRHRFLTWTARIEPRRAFVQRVTQPNVPILSSSSPKRTRSCTGRSLVRRTRAGFLHPLGSALKARWTTDQCRHSRLYRQLLEVQPDSPFIGGSRSEEKR